jgi:hypothetical protein
MTMDRRDRVGSGSESDPLAQKIFLFALALGFVRFVLLGQWSLWLDEAFTLADVYNREGFDNPLGYGLFGLFYGFVDGRPDEFLLRFPSAVFGWLVIPTTYLVFRPILGARPAAGAALVIACSSWHLYWSQTARFYTLAQLLALGGGGLLLSGIERGRSLFLGIGLFLLALSPLAHPSALLLGVPLVMLPWTSLWFQRPPTEAIEKVPWNLLSLCAFLGVGAGAGWALEVWSKYQAQKGGGSTLHLFVTSGYYLTPTVGVAFLFGAWIVIKDRLHRGFIPLAVAVPSLCFAVVASLFVLVSAQYVFVLLPWLAAVAVVPLMKTIRRRSSTILFLGFLVLPGCLDSGLYFLRNGDRPRWREAYAYVFDHRRESDLVFGMDAPVGEFYLDPWKTDLRDWRAVTWLDIWRIRQNQDWQRYDRRTWYVVNDELLSVWTPELREELREILRDCREVATFPLSWTPRDLGVSVYLSD